MRCAKFFVPFYILIYLLNAQDSIKFNMENIDINELEKECNSNDSMSCVILGDAYFLGEKVKKNTQKALELYIKSCNDGLGETCVILSREYDNGNDELGIKIDLVKSFNFALKACKLNQIFACKVSGDKYRAGKGVKKDLTKAKEYYEKSCSGVYFDSCFNLGLMYEKGDGVKQDFLKAKEYHTRACNFDIYKSCYNLGVLYANGQGARQDYAKARDLFTQACNGKMANA